MDNINNFLNEIHDLQSKSSGGSWYSESNAIAKFYQLTEEDKENGDIWGRNGIIFGEGASHLIAVSANENMTQGLWDIAYIAKVASPEDGYITQTLKMLKIMLAKADIETIEQCEELLENRRENLNSIETKE